MSAQVKIGEQLKKKRASIFIETLGFDFKWSAKKYLKSKRTSYPIKKKM